MSGWIALVLVCLALWVYSRLLTYYTYVWNAEETLKEYIAAEESVSSAADGDSHMAVAAATTAGQADQQASLREVEVG